MGWQDLRALRAAVRHGSITAAAAVLDRTRPALSRRIARLERQLGTPLLVRTPRSCVPTDAGRLLVDSAAHPGLGHLVGPGVLMPGDDYAVVRPSDAPLGRCRPSHTSTAGESTDRQHRPLRH
ncbi:LysR family transcriptional regulator [Micromonospora sp. NPDC049240]|uniref:helix-turn-helix domain-containing protein n=1 Tax=Micromonospora sp. NPDC049240 TaxID=3155151 RepID=UPI0033C2B216